MNKYITTTLPYANSKAHIGHAFEFIIGDALSRHFKHKLGADKVHFNIGLDEHGEKIYLAALAADKTPADYLEDLYDQWLPFCELFKIKYDSFYTTSSPKHYENVSKFWNYCLEKGLIYKANYNGKLCVGCEAYKTDSELIDGKCSDHHNLEIQEIEEENYFFRLSTFKDELLKWVDSDIDLKPISKLSELRNSIENLQDISISRNVTRVPWGIPVPNDPHHIIYVWFEALLNYIFVISYYEDRERFNNYWNDSIQIFGPDNLRFQAIIFQGLLRAADLPFTKTLLCHGTILDKHGKKISKSVGNVIDPIEQVEKFGVDAVRYYALCGLQTYSNSGWDEDALIKLHNSHLADNYGNLISRVVHLINLKEAELGREYNLVNIEELKEFKEQFDEVNNLWDNHQVGLALTKLAEILKSINQLITEQEPWKKDAKEVEVLLTNVLCVLKEATKHYLSVIPDKATEALESLNLKSKKVIFPKIKESKA